MNTERDIQLAQILDSSTPEMILELVLGYFRHNHGHDFSAVLTGPFHRVRDLFEGRYPGYGPCDTPYHNYPHTLDVFLASARILDGYLYACPDYPERMAAACLTGALFHDVGYITKETDTLGTGAKYTTTHVERSIQFLREHNEDFGIGADLVRPLGRMIKATRFAGDFAEIAFESEEEKTAAAILGSADLIGQMSNRDYLERLLFLYYEFREANIPGYNTEFDILNKTLAFYELVSKRLAGSFMNVSAHVRTHFKEEHNVDIDLYQRAISRQIDYLKTIIADESTNFRNKLHRADWINHEMQGVG